MKKILSLMVVLLTLAVAFPVFAASSDAWTDVQKISYILGSQVGTLSKTGEFQIDMKVLKKGINDTVNGKESAVSEEDIKKVMTEFQKKAKEKQMAANNAATEENLKAGLAFLEANKKKDGVKETPSGLQYKVLKDGDGPSPEATDKVKVHYSGTLIDGKEFDSSYKRGAPAEFPLNRVIKGWTEGVQLMKVGSKFEFYIPEQLAYGQNAPPTIGPSQTLIFVVELLEVVK